MIRYVPIDNLQCFTSQMLQVCNAQDNWSVQNQNFAALNFGGYCTAFSLSVALEQEKSPERNIISWQFCISPIFFLG